jgi:radical SAM/Cys-rich protein
VNTASRRDPTHHSSFDAALASCGASPLRREHLETVQVNLGKRCNQACHHCHVEAGPGRKEMMTRHTAETVCNLLGRSPGIHTVDLTGGAPELNSNFRDLVAAARALGKRTIDRCNLTVLFEPGFDWLAGFLAEQHVDLVCSLPCYGPENVTRQRGQGVFEKSIEALSLLNRLGFGMPGSGLSLDLVYNPVGAFLPPPQAELEVRYREELGQRFGLRFNRLFTITNMPIKRFADDLVRQGRYEEYLDLLVTSFNPAAVDSLMCRALVSVGWDGKLYDCDFNQMLEIPLVRDGRPLSLDHLQSFDELSTNSVSTAIHCFGCTAGAGSSCGGALAEA